MSGEDITDTEGYTHTHVMKWERATKVPIPAWPDRVIPDTGTVWQRNPTEKSHLPAPYGQQDLGNV